MLILLPAVAFAQPTLAADYTIINLGGNTAIAINDKNQIAGQLTNQYSFHAVLWERGVMSDLGTLGGRTSTLGASRHCLNNNGQVVGWSETTTAASHAFVWQNGVMTDLTPLPGTYSSAVAINDAGQIAGTSVGGAIPVSHAVTRQNGAMVDLGALMPNGSSAATDISASGQVTGWADTAPGVRHAFIWKGFRLFWTWTVRHGQPGRPSVPKHVGDLIRLMSRANPTWGAPRIHVELLKLGMNIGETR